MSDAVGFTPRRRRKISLAIWCGLLIASIGVCGSAAQAAHFTTGENAAARFGVHEVSLTAAEAVGNPFDVRASVTFVPPSGEANARAVQAFYDGGQTWRARVYVSEPGLWRWTSRGDAGSGLRAGSGQFTALGSPLRGRLLPHTKNSRQWMTEDGRWFLNLSDTAYFLLCTHDGAGQPVSAEDFSAYVRDVAAQEISSVRCYLASGAAGFTGADGSDGHRWDEIFADKTHEQLRLDNLQNVDRRLQWMLDEYPGLYVQLVLFPLGSGYAKDDHIWRKLNDSQKQRLLRHLVARYAAFPQIFWLVSNDVHYGEKFPYNNDFAREVGAYVRQHDVWSHPLSTGHARRVPFHFASEDWASYIHIEDEADLAAQKYELYDRFAKPVFLGEDRYEQDHGPVRDPANMRYFQRRLFWAWTLAGGSTNYGGRWWVVQPYRQTADRPVAGPGPRSSTLRFTTGLTGLDSVPFISRYFRDRQIDLADFAAGHELLSDPETPQKADLKLMHRSTDEYLAYHPNAAEEGRNTRVDTNRSASFSLDLTNSPGRYAVEWYRPEDGLAEKAADVDGGGSVALVSPWRGCDAVVRLVRRSSR